MDERKRKICIIACAVIGLSPALKKRKKRSLWQKKWLAEREERSHMTLLRELRSNYPKDFENYLNMDSETFDVLLNIMQPHLTKQDTSFRKSISAEERLVATPLFLATGRTYEDLKFSTRISPQALRIIIPETCKILYKELQKDNLKVPSSEEEWDKISEGFNLRWQIPNCGGAIDGKHIRIKQPAKTGALYYNYKHYYSIVLLAIVNAEYEFLYIDVGKNGRLSDGGVLNESTFFHHLTSDRLNLPKNEDNVANLNFVFIGDEAFGLHQHILKRFPQTDLSHDRRIYNYRLSRGRNVVENVFGQIAAKFRILHTPIYVKVGKICDIVMAICVLHNFLRRRRHCYIYNITNFDNRTSPTININTARPHNGIQQQTVHITSTLMAKENRDKYVSYFNTEGAVPWQEEMLLKGKS